MSLTHEHTTFPQHLQFQCVHSTFIPNFLWCSLPPGLSTNSWLLLPSQLRKGQAKVRWRDAAPSLGLAPSPHISFSHHFSIIGSSLPPPLIHTQRPQIHLVPILVTLVLVTWLVSSCPTPRLSPAHYHFCHMSPPGAPSSNKPKSNLQPGHDVELCPLPSLLLGAQKQCLSTPWRIIPLCQALEEPGLGSERSLTCRRQA